MVRSPFRLQSPWGMVHAFDIDPEMIQKARNNVNSAGLSNVLFYQRDVMEIGTGLPDESMHTVLLFNILHSAENRLLLTESARILQASGSYSSFTGAKMYQLLAVLSAKADLTSIQFSNRSLVWTYFFNGNATIIEPHHRGIVLTKRGTDAGFKDRT